MQMIANFSNRIERLKSTTSFPLNVNGVRDFEKEDIAKASLAAIDKNLPFIVECDASEVAVSATLNQGGRLVAFMSRTLHASEHHYPAVEKEATAITEEVRKWNHFLARGQFTLATDQRSVLFDCKSLMQKRSKIKKNKIQSWRLKLASLAYNIDFQPGKENIAQAALTRAFCANFHNRNLRQLNENLCHPGISRLAHYIRAKNRPFSVEDVEKVCLSCQVCAELKPRFCKPPQNTFIKAAQPFERLAIDFKEPLPSSSRNFYILVVVDEFSRFPFCFPCHNMSSQTVINCLDRLLTLCGIPGCIHSDNATTFVSAEFKSYLIKW